MLGSAPLSCVGNRVGCVCCGRGMAASAAGAHVEATYTGPVLTNVRVTKGTKVLHDCQEGDQEA